MLSNLIITDLECTCWDDYSDKSANRMETIQIGAVKVDGDTGNVIGKFNEFVRPIKNRTLTDFCMELTKIRQRDVDAADEFPAVFYRYLDWIGGMSDATLVSWGNFDRSQFIRDCQLHAIDFPFDDHVNLKYEFTKMRGNNKARGLSKALAKIGLTFEGQQHNGLDDAVNTARIYQWMLGKAKETS